MGDAYAEFDAYCDANDIPMEDTPIAFAAFLHLKSGGTWDGDCERVGSAP